MSCRPEHGNLREMAMSSMIVPLARQQLAEQIPMLRNAARGLCRNASEAEDLVQDVLERVLRSIHTLDLKMNPRGWMVTILHNLHIDQCRKHARQGPHIPWEETMPLAAPEHCDELAESSFTTDDVLHCTAQLPADLRDAFTLFALEGRTYAEVATALGIAKATVGTRILRARACLKKLLVADLQRRALEPDPRSQGRSPRAGVYPLSDSRDS